METQDKKRHVHTGGGSLWNQHHHQAECRAPLQFTRRFICHHKGLGGKKYLCLTLNWYYPNRTKGLSMSKYFKAALHKFHHPTPLKPQDVPHRWNSPTYREATEYADPEDNLAPLPPEGITMVIKTVGTFLYYDLAVDSTILVSLSDLTATQSKVTEKTYNNIVWLLNYAVSHPTTVFRYKQIKMIL